MTRRTRDNLFCLFLINVQVCILVIPSTNCKHFQRVDRSKDHQTRHSSFHNFFRPPQSNRVKRDDDDESSICETCRATSHDIPFYCPIKLDLPQCIFPTCPKACDEIGGDPGVKIKPVPSRSIKMKHYVPPPPPVNLPRIPMDRVHEFLPPSKENETEVEGGHEITETPILMHKESHKEKISPYNAQTCEFPTPNLRRIRPGSKYIEYRPADPNLQISDIHDIAVKYGLALAEFRHPLEWYSVEKSSVMESVSTYKLTVEMPRLFYVVGLSDKHGEDEKDELGKFPYKSDNTSPTFAVFDPRIYGRTDERCGVLSHVLGSDKRQYLTTRFWNCHKYMADGLRVAYGLFMYPPGSLCHTRSEEECARLQQELAGGDALYHNTIQIGQTLKRFIYLYTDQRSWNDAFTLCKAKGLHMLDFDIKWGDALRIGDVIEHFLRDTRLNPVTAFWTAGRFHKAFSDGGFTWATTNTRFENQYKDEAPPFAFSFWDDQKVEEEVEELSRRTVMKQPCVALALNPEIGGERPKLNFKTWYCDFPMYVLCYKEINATDTIGNPVPQPITANRKPPDPESCEKSPEEEGGGDGGTHEKEEIHPFDEKTCTSKSLTVKRLTPNSKFVDYQPKIGSYSVEQIKEQCRKYGLLPAEIRTREDWDSIDKSGIGGVVESEGDNEGGTADYFYVIGMDDSEEFGKMRYSCGDELTFSMFYGGAKSDIGDQCAMLEVVTGPAGVSRGLMMLHVNCQEGLMSKEKIAYGLCMFPPEWNCYKNSGEEAAAAADKEKFTTIIPLGATENRSIFFNPIQRNWDEAMKFSKAANLTLIDFDPKWDDMPQVIGIVKEKLIKDGGLFQLTSFWTSGKLKGLYHEDKGAWESTGTHLKFPNGSNFLWVHRQYPMLSQIREGVHKDACVETTFDSINLTARFRPDYCDIPKYFLMYRVTKRRGDPPGTNHLGITIIETGSREVDTRILNPNPRKPATAALISSITKSLISNKTDEKRYTNNEVTEIDNVYEKDKKREVILDNTLSTSDIVNNPSEVLESESVSGSSSSEEDYDVDMTDYYVSTTKPASAKENETSKSSKRNDDKTRIPSILKTNSIATFDVDITESESVSGSSSSSSEEEGENNIKNDAQKDKKS